MTIKKYFSRYWFIGTMTLIGFCIRYWASVHQPVFSEEAFSLFEAKHWNPPYDPSYPPGYPLFLKLWTGFSTALTWARLPNVVAGTVSIIVFWYMLYRNFSLFYANIGAFLLAFSALHIHYSWVARPHAFMMFASILSMAFSLEFAAMLQKHKIPPTHLLLLYLLINTFGALMSHGYSMFLGGSLIALIVWAHRSTMLPVLWKEHKHKILLLSLHVLLPAIQYSFIHNHLHPLIDSAVWIPDFSLNTTISVFLTLLNSTKVLNGELYSSEQIVVYIIVVVIFIMSRMFCVFLNKRYPFLVIYSLSIIGVAFASVIVVFRLLDITILQPRLLIPITTLYIIGLTVTIPELFRLIRKNRLGKAAYVYESIFLFIFLIFGIRSTIFLNILPYYSHPDTIRAVTDLHSYKGAIAVFPRYQTITVHYLFGLHTDSHPTLTWADKLLSLADTSADKFLDTIPLNTPFKVVLWPPDAALSPGAQAVVNYLTPHCRAHHYPRLVILDCSPIAQKS